MVKLTHAVSVGQQNEEEQKHAQARLNSILDEEATLDGWICQMRGINQQHKSSRSSNHNRIRSPCVSSRSSTTSSPYFFGGSSPFSLQTTPSADRLVQVSSEDTEESVPSARSVSSAMSPPSLQIVSITESNTSRKRVVLLPWSVDQGKRHTRRRLETSGKKRLVFLDEKKDHSSSPEQGGEK